MLGNHLLLPINFLDAALAANHTYRLRLPFGVTLEGVSAAAADTTSFILDIGTAADSDAYLDGVTVTGAASTTRGRFLSLCRNGRTRRTGPILLTRPCSRSST